MTNRVNKAKKNLEARRADFDRIPADRRRGFKRPGSLNSHKQQAGTPTGGGRR